MGAADYESWFLSARDPGSPRALWIRHTRYRPQAGPESAATWCTLVDPGLGQRLAVLKEISAAARGALPRPASGRDLMEQSLHAI